MYAHPRISRFPCARSRSICASALRHHPSLHLILHGKNRLPPARPKGKMRDAVEKRSKRLSSGVCAQEAGLSSDPRSITTQPDSSSSNPWEARLLATTAVQRLHAVSQLGFVDRIWPQATHSRFEHSLGCYQLARHAVAHLHACSSRQSSALFSPTQVQTFLLAALLHDVGHYPFSHSLDGLRSLLPAHELVWLALLA